MGRVSSTDLLVILTLWTEGLTVTYCYWRSGVVGQINEVTLCLARLVLGWVIQVNSAWSSLRGQAQ